MLPKAAQLTVEIVKIEGECPTYEIGDTFIIRDGYKLQSKMPLCLHALQGLMPYYVALSHGIGPYDLGLSAKDANQETKEAFIQCQDPEEITGGGRVVFKISIVE
jgi:uncharacterized repeat protein (TIGR04076 family)